MDPDPQPARGRRLARVGHEGTLDVARDGDRGGGGRENGDRSGALAEALEADPPVGRDRGIDDPVRPVGAHGGALDVGEQERHGPRRRIGSRLTSHRPRVSPPSGPRHDTRQTTRRLDHPDGR
jgi:hypothetical protein